MKDVYYRKYRLYIHIFIVLLLCYIAYKTSSHIYENFEYKNTVSFITYGNEKFSSSRERIIKEAGQMGIFDGIIKGYSEADIDEDFKETVKDAIYGDRGGGYWIWKPYIIHKTMKMLNNNDYLVYSDAGSRLNSSGVDRLKEYIEMIKPETGKSILAMELAGFKESVWTTSEIFNYFDVEDNIKNSSQIIATVVIFRKSSESLNMIDKWLETAVKKPLIFTDHYNDEARRLNPEFRDNRHDQSIFSIILKQEPYKSNTVIIGDEVDSQLPKNPILALRLKN